MLTKISLKQAFRTPVRLLVTYLVIIVVCVFFIISINLRQTAEQNIDLLEREFQVVAVPDFQASVNKYGGLCATSYDSGYAGYLEASAEDYDLSLLKDIPGVLRIETHDYCGAYVRQAEKLYYDPPAMATDFIKDVMVFTYKGSEPVIVPNIVEADEPIRISVEVLNSAMNQEGRFLSGTMLIENNIDLFQGASMTSAIQRMGLDSMFENDRAERTLKNGTFILQPGETYIATGYCWNSSAGQVFTIEMDDTHCKVTSHYRGGTFVTQALPQAYEEFADFLPPIIPYSVSCDSTEAQEWFAEAKKGCIINANSLTAIGTNQMSAILPFHNGDVYISEGRAITSEEYEQGSPVCVISAFLARINGWQVGDMLDLSFYNSFYGIASSVNEARSFYQPFREVKDMDGIYSLEKYDPFFTTGQFEIVGLYDGAVSMSDQAANLQYNRDEGMNRFTVIVPKAAISGVKESAINQYNTTLILDGLQVPVFMSAIEGSGLMQPQDGGYELNMTIYDDGASVMLQSLRQLDIISRLTLYLACAAAVVVIVLMAVLTVLQNRRQIATLRSLGIRKWQIPTAVLSGVLLVCLVGAVAGGVLGHTLSDRVAEYILDTAQLDLADTSFSAMLAKEDVEEENQYAIALQSQPKTAIFASAAVWGALTLLCCILVLPEAGKSPMLTLGAKE